MPTTCEINFEENPKRIFFSGQKLHVTVRLKLTEEIKVRGVDIHLRGVAYVRFSVDDSNRAGHYASDENVLDMRKCLVDGNGENRVVLPVGTHDFSFTCTLPDELPSTFAGTHGYIKYSAQVVLRIPFWPDKKFEKKFTVFKIVNLNDYPSLRDEVSGRNVYITYEYKLLSVSARIPAGGYANGQHINVQVTAINDTAYPVRHFVVYIRRQTIYHHKSTYSENQKTKYSVMKKQVMSNWKCEQNAHRTFPVESIQVPAMIPPTDTETSEIIKIKYMVTISVIMGIYNRPTEVRMLNLPITIGTIPFDGNALTVLPQTRTVSSAPPEDTWSIGPRPVQPSTPSFPNDDTVSIRTYTSTPPPFPDDDFDLPTYEDALQMDEEIDVNLRSIEDSFAQLHVKSMNK